MPGSPLYAPLPSPKRVSPLPASPRRFSPRRSPTRRLPSQRSPVRRSSPRRGSPRRSLSRQSPSRRSSPRRDSYRRDSSRRSSTRRRASKFDDLDSSRDDVAESGSRRHDDTASSLARPEANTSIEDRDSANASSSRLDDSGADETTPTCVRAVTKEMGPFVAKSKLEREAIVKEMMTYGHYNGTFDIQDCILYLLLHCREQRVCRPNCALYNRQKLLNHRHKPLCRSRSEGRDAERSTHRSHCQCQVAAACRLAQHFECQHLPKDRDAHVQRS